MTDSAPPTRAVTTPATYDALDDFAGPGGWDVGAQMLGLHLLGVDYDEAACETAIAAGFARERADVTAHESPEWARGKGYISSPSCTLFSMAGSGIGRLVIDVLRDGVKHILTGDDPATVRDMARGSIYPVALAEAEAKNAKRAPEKRWPEAKVQEKARLDAKIAALVLEPARRIVELEPEWVAMEQVPEVLGIWNAYYTVLSNQGWSVWVGVMNAADYGVPQTRERAILIASRVRAVAPPSATHAQHPQGDDLFGESHEKWVSVAEALGWDPSESIRPARGAGMIARHGDRPDHPATSPSPTVISKARSWIRGNQFTSTTGRYYQRPTTQPAPTLTSVVRSWDWTDGSDAPKGTGSRVEVSEAGVLQSFPDDYPWCGTRSKQFEQVGNAIPPLLAAHVLAAVTGRPLELAVAA